MALPLTSEKFARYFCVLLAVLLCVSNYINLLFKDYLRRGGGRGACGVKAMTNRLDGEIIAQKFAVASLFLLNLKVKCITGTRLVINCLNLLQCMCSYGTKIGDGE